MKGKRSGLSLGATAAVGLCLIAAGGVGAPASGRPTLTRDTAATTRSAPKPSFALLGRTLKTYKAPLGSAYVTLTKQAAQAGTQASHGKPCGAVKALATIVKKTRTIKGAKAHAAVASILPLASALQVQ